jgi:hypothetical protein
VLSVTLEIDTLTTTAGGPRRAHPRPEEEVLGTFDLRVIHHRIVGDRQPVDEPVAAVHEHAIFGENKFAMLPDAVLVGPQGRTGSVKLLAEREKSAFRFAEVNVVAPLIAAGAVKPHAAARYQKLKLSSGNIVPNVDGLDNHRLDTDLRTSRQVAQVAVTGEIELVTPSTGVPCRGHGGKAVGQIGADGPGGQVVAGIGLPAAAAARRIGGDGRVVYVAALERRVDIGFPCALGLTTVPVAAGVARVKVG